MKRRSMIAGGVAAAAGGIGGAAWLLGRDDGLSACGGSSVAGSAIGGDFTLVNAAGGSVTRADVITEPSLIYFGFTFCPDICPVDVARNAAAVDLLADAGLAVTPVFVSVDPGRDTPDVVGRFARAMHPRMVGLTGSQAQIDAATSAYSVYDSVPADTSGNYVVGHSSFTYLDLPQEGVVAVFRRDLGPSELADSVSCFIRSV